PDGYVRVRLTPAPPPDVDDGPAATELRLAVDLDVQLARLEQLVTERVRERDGVVDRRAVEPVDLAVKAVVERKQVGNDGPDATRRAQPLGVARRHERLMSHVEPDHRHV